MDHIPIRVWQEKLGEISWLCSCGCHNKHYPLPTDLRCAQQKTSLTFLPGPSQCVESEYQMVVIR